MDVRVLCAACGGGNEAGRRFCGDCGAPLALTCSACGASNEARARFCGDCGRPLAPGLVALSPDSGGNGSAGAAHSASPAQPVTERRLVSVLFADLVSFTSLSEARDSEEVRELLSRYFDTCTTVVGRYGGTVEKFIGDAVMAVWGTPVANEDDAERAVRAALELVDAVSLLGEEVGLPGLHARAGVLTGEATVNLGMTGQGMVAGDLVNTASRLQATAEPGSVVVGDSTKRATDAAVSYTDAGVHTLKGKTEPMRLWQAHRVVAGVRGLMRSEGLEAPFVGRDRELKLVKDLFHACGDESRAHVVQVTGIAGIGKSRLGWEFFKYMDGLRRLFWWHRGRCLSYGEGVTYWALAEMVRGRAGITEGEERTSALKKLRDVVERHVPDAADRRFVEPRLAHLLGLEDRATSDKGDLFAGWRLFFERLAATDPVVMVFEDLQWADPSLLEFIDHLLEWSRALPIFVLTLARPGGGDGIAARPRRNATSLYLEPLSRQAMEELLTGLVPGLPASLTTRILDRAEGVPLYAVETVRMLLDRGLLVQEGSFYRPAGPIPDLEVPETLHALISARLDGLTPDERRVVQNASVLGKTCSRAALAAVSGMPERELEPLLAGLLAKEVLFVQADPRSPERGQYGFLQDLVRTVAYETLAKRDRKAKHLQVAAFLEMTWGQDEDEIVEVVASHVVEAYRLAPDAGDAPAIRDKARSMLTRAGERAASLAAAEEAAVYFERAAELTDSDEEHARLLEQAGRMALLLGRVDHAEERFIEARRLFTEAGLDHPAARVEAELANASMLRNHLDKAIESMRAAYEVLKDETPDRDVAMVAAQYGRFLAVAARDGEATPVLEHALRLAEHLKLSDVYSHALSSRAIGLQRQARFDESVTLLRRALEVALEHDIADAAFRAWNNLGVALESLDRFREEMAFRDTALEASRRKGDRANELGVLVGFLGPQVWLGDWDEAVAITDDLLRTAADELASLPWVASGLTAVALVHVRRGDLDRANTLLDIGHRTIEGGNQELWANGVAVEAEYLRATGRPAEAVTLAEGLVDVAPVLGLCAVPVKHGLSVLVDAAIDAGDLERADRVLGMFRDALPGFISPWVRGQTARLTARLAQARGQAEGIEVMLRSAAADFHAVEMPFEEAVALGELAEWLHAEGRDDDAGTVADEARRLLTGLGATPWLERLAPLPAAHRRIEVVGA